MATCRSRSISCSSCPPSSSCSAKPSILFGVSTPVSAFQASLAEMAAPGNRQKLWYGIWSGFAVAIGFAVLATAAAFFGLTPWKWAYITLVSTKLLTNSLAWLGLARDRWVMETQGLNTIADVVLLTAAIYFTGGAYSPLLPTYVIVVTVLSLLSNLAITIAI